MNPVETRTDGQLAKISGPYRFSSFVYRSCGDLKSPLLGAGPAIGLLAAIQSPERAKGSVTLADLIHPEDLARVQTEFDRVISSGLPCHTSYRLLTAPKTLRVIDSLCPLDDGVSGARIIEGCMTPAEAAPALALSSPDAQADKLRAVAEATDKLAHDFNNILAVVVSNLDLLMRRVDRDDRAFRSAERAMAAAVRGCQENESLLAFARKRQAKAETLDLGDAVVNLLSGPRAQLKQKQIELILETSSTPLLVDIDLDDLGSSLLHIINNAEDVLPHGGKIRVTVSAVEGEMLRELRSKDRERTAWALLEISDTGTGMPAEVLDRCLEPFFTTKATHRRSGLGLSAAFGFVRRSDGHLVVSSAPGLGTTVQIILPLSGSARNPKGAALDEIAPKE